MLFSDTHKQSSRRLAFPHLARVFDLKSPRLRSPGSFDSRASLKVKAVPAVPVIVLLLIVSD